MTESNEREFTVRWLERYRLTVKGVTTREQAIEYAKDHLNDGENTECFEFFATEN